MPSSNGTRSSHGWLGVFIASFIFMILLGWYYRRPEALGDSASRFALSLLAACNQGDMDRIEYLEEALATSEMQKDISRVEFRLLTGIIEDAKRGNWEDARSDIRWILVSQALESSDYSDSK